MSDAILQCQALSKRFRQGNLDVSVLKNVNLSINAGERVALVGASGSRKSTLLYLLGGLEQPTEGKVMLAGADLNKIGAAKLNQLRNKSLGFIYQFHHLLGEFTALENVAMPMLIAGASVKQAQQQAAQLLERVGLAHRMQHKPGELSGGERQRTAVARALINRPKCILADEPTGNLDRKTAEQTYQLLLELNRELHVSFLVATHDQVLAQNMDRVLQMDDGLILAADN